MGSTSGDVPGTLGGLSLGVIEFNASTSSGNLTINNSSTDTSFLRLNGTDSSTTLVTVGGSRDLTITDGNGTMNLRLGITNGVFQVATDRTLTVGSTITQVNTNSGFTVQGGGTMVLTGDNSGGYSGTTTISANVTNPNTKLQIGDGGGTGTLGGGNVTNNGTLAFNRNNSYTVGNVISGNGAVVQAGSGTTILTGANDYTGTTTVSTGTLQIGNGGEVGTLGSGDVTTNATLSFRRSNEYSVGNLIGGTGGVTQAGGGTTILTNTNTYLGATNVNAGTLLVNGDQSGTTGSHAVNGGTLGGTGTLGGSITVNSGGTIRGGSSNSPLGTLTVGNTTIKDGGNLLANLNLTGGTATNSSLNVGGNTLNFETGSILKLSKDTFEYSVDGPTKEFTLATLTNGATLLHAGDDHGDGYVFADYRHGTGDINGRPVSIDASGLSLQNGDRLTLRRQGNDLVLAFTPVPEPASLLAVCGLAVGGFALVRRRLRRKATPADHSPAA